MSVVFLSYRRSDSQDVTGRIYDRLLAKFTEKQVFKDVDSIPMGVSFPLHIKQMLGKADVVLVIIGPNWLHDKDEQGNRRLEHPNDYVRLEIEIALRAAVPVIPVLVSNARMPVASELPRSIHQLALRNGMAVRPDPDFNNDIARLLSELDRLEKLITAHNAKSLQVKSPSPKSATAKRAAAIPAEPLPAIRPTAAEGSATVDRAKQQAAAGSAPVSGARGPRKWSMLPLAGLFLLIAGAIGLWAGGVLPLKIPKGIMQPRPFAGGGIRDDYDLTGGNRFVHFGPNGPRVVLSYNENEQYFARVYDLVTGKAMTPPLEHDGYILQVAFSPDGMRVVTLFGGKTVFANDTARFWDAATGEALTPPLKQKYSLFHAAFSPDSQHVVITGMFEARVWDAATGKEVAPPVQHEDAVWYAVFSPDSNRVVTTSKDKTARVWDAATGKEIVPPLRHEDSVQKAFFSPDGKRIVTRSDDKTVRVWDAATGQELTPPPLKHEDNFWSVNLSADGARLVTCSDKTVRVWDAATGQALSPPLKHEDEVLRANFSADGARLVTSAEKTARVWDAATGQALSPPLRHDERVFNAVFSPDGKQVVTRAQMSCRLWDAQTGQELNKVTISR